MQEKLSDKLLKDLKYIPDKSNKNSIFRSSTLAR